MGGLGLCVQQALTAFLEAHFSEGLSRAAEDQQPAKCTAPPSAPRPVVVSAGAPEGEGGPGGEVAPGGGRTRPTGGIGVLGSRAGGLEPAWLVHPPSRTRWMCIWLPTSPRSGACVSISTACPQRVRNQHFSYKLKLGELNTARPWEMELEETVDNRASKSHQEC